MTKLSKTQNMVLGRIIAEVEEMRSKTLEEFLNKNYEHSYQKRSRNETYKEWFDEEGELLTTWYYNTCKGYITVYNVNKRTLAKLQEAGYIESIAPWYNNNEKIQVNLEACGIR